MTGRTAGTGFGKRAIAVLMAACAVVGCGGSEAPMLAPSQVGCQDVNVGRWLDVPSSGPVSVRVPQPPGWEINEDVARRAQEMMASDRSTAGPAPVFLIGPTPEGGSEASVFMASVDQVIPVGAPPTVDATLDDLVDGIVEARRADGTTVEGPSSATACGHALRYYLITPKPTEADAHPTTGYQSQIVIQVDGTFYGVQIGYRPANSSSEPIRNDLDTMVRGIHITTP
ncbi:hypothetical protein [Mycolicibacterium obuense]|uniref:Lipoprotein LpqN n=1 Tax=Mycolicibacterium obuense TaxID=1807 RepID=A0A0M2JUZ5_9MYCO|nr:hypothetical protein [Mycolicibacterium obuense]KKE98622.1 hypothetical protein WN67_28240 [Mycolicibacterium obuense]